MELKILKLVYDYSTKGRLADKSFIDKLIEIVVVEKSINNYVRNLSFTNKLDKNSYGVECAAYSPLSKMILMDYESMQIILDNKSYYNQLFNDFEQIIYKNLIITQVILHELEHAYQHKQADNKMDNAIETKLINASFVLEQAMKNPEFLAAILKGEISAKNVLTYMLQNKELYKQYYSFNPTERLAQINSCRTIVNSLEPIKNYIPNLFEFQNASLVEEMLNGYEDSWSQGICPTEVYLSGTNQSNVWYEFDFYDQDSSQLMKNVFSEYSLNRRLQLGLPVSYNEYDVTYTWLQSTNKFNI